MRVVQVLDTLLIGGAQKMQLFLAQSLHPLGVELTVVNISNKFDPDLVAKIEQAGARVVSFHFRGMGLSTFFKLVAFFRREKFDLIHAYLTRSNIIGSFAGLLTGIPVIASLRSEKYNRSKLKRILEDFSLRYLATRVMGNGEAVGIFARSRSGKTPVDVIVNAVDLTPPLPEAERISLRTEIVVDPTRPIILSVGRLTIAKGFFDLLDAFKIVLEKNPRAALVIAGGGNLKDGLVAHIEKLGLQNDVFLLGLRHDIPQLLAAADVYVNSSYWEGTPVSVLEAMSAGLPIVGTTVGENPYLLEQEAGLLVSPGQPRELAAALITLLDSPSAGKKFGAKARSRIEQEFSREAWIRRILDLYIKIVPSAEVHLAKFEAGLNAKTDQAAA